MLRLVLRSAGAVLRAMLLPSSYCRVSGTSPDGDSGAATTSAQNESFPGSSAPGVDAPSSSTVTGVPIKSTLVRLFQASERRKETTWTNSVKEFICQYWDWTSSAVMIAPFSAKSTSNCNLQ